MSFVMSASIDQPTRRSTPAEDTRRRIEDTAERLFRTMGYQKTAVADIARELGMSPANVYRFFASKAAINEAIAQRMLRTMLAEIDAIAAGPGTAPERLRRLFSALFELKLAAFFEERRLHDMVSAAMEESWGVVNEYIERVEAATTRILADGMASGAFAPAEPAALAKTVLHTMVAWNHPTLLAWCIGRKGQTVEELRAQVADMTAFVLRGLRP
jgi:AcrR family transcriptional regulator